MSKQNSAGDSLNREDYAQTVDEHGKDITAVKTRLDELELFRKGNEGKELDTKICKAIEDSTHIQETISSIVWKTIKEKVIWILVTLIALLLWDVLKDFIANWIPKS